MPLSIRGLPHTQLDQLTIGNVHVDTVAQIIERGRAHPYVGKVFREGLTAIRDEILARDPQALPGATSNHCFFCWYVLTKGAFDPEQGGGSPWARLRTALPMVEGRPSPERSGCSRGACGG